MLVLYHCFSDICFLRLDFEQFDVIEYTPDGTGTQPAVTGTKCADGDHLIITVSMVPIYSANIRCKISYLLSNAYF